MWQQSLNQLLTPRKLGSTITLVQELASAAADGIVARRRAYIGCSEFHVLVSERTSELPT